MPNKQIKQTRPGRVATVKRVDNGLSRGRIVSLKDVEAAILEKKYGSLTKAIKSLLK